MSFLDDDYKVPSTSRYMKWQEGQNQFRILGSFVEGTAIMGYEYWKSTEEGGRKPVRVKLGISVPIAELEENPKTGELDLPKHFWALPVWNYAEKSFQILEITQKTIMNAIKDLARNKKWGDPKNYDINVTRTTENSKTKYTVMPEPKEKLTEEIEEQIALVKINIHALYDGEDPFQVSLETVHPDEVKV